MLIGLEILVQLSALAGRILFYEGTPPVVDAPPPVHMCPGMHTPSYEGTPPVVDAVHMVLVCHTPSYEGTPPVVDGPPPVHMRPGMHTPRYEGTPPVVDAALVDAPPQL